MKRKFTAPEMEIRIFRNENVVTTSSSEPQDTFKSGMAEAVGIAENEITTRKLNEFVAITF